MYVHDERAQARFISENFRHWVANRIWGTAIWTKDEQRKLLKKIEALDPETAPLSEYERILGKTHFVLPKDCDECHQGRWDVVVFTPYSDETRGSCVCKECLTNAITLAK